MSIEPFSIVSGRAAPLMLQNVDTDVIIRIDRLTSLRKDQLGPYAFESLRFQQDGSENDSFVLNQPAFRRAPILLAGSNFGCGSSREGAVWALQGIGVRCVLAPSFGDIFFNNCFQNGMLPIRLPLERIEALASQACADAPFTIDLINRLVTAPDGSGSPFELESVQRESLLEGLTDLELSLRDIEHIAGWEEREAELRPWNSPGFTAPRTSNMETGQ
jgi:3-isopropylmalate/(R)-2-methylmalate dehydratase small subunit